MSTAISPNRYGHSLYFRKDRAIVFPHSSSSLDVALLLQLVLKQRDCSRLPVSHVSNLLWSSRRARNKTRSDPVTS
jgi:hypothetical protein